MYHIERAESATIVRVSGEIDLTSRQLFDDLVRLAELAEPPVLIVDLTGCTYIDSSGLAALVRSQHHAHRHIVVVAAKSPCVTRVFSICRLDTVFHIVDDLDDAIRHHAA